MELTPKTNYRIKAKCYGFEAGDTVKTDASGDSLIRGEKTPSMVMVSRPGMAGALFVDESNLTAA